MSVAVIVKGDAAGAADEVGRRLAVAARVGGNLVLTGGNTVGEAYETAAALESDWSRVELWWGDERCVPPDDDKSNFGLAKRTLLDRLEGQPAAVHRIQGELEPEEAAARYADELHGITFDLVLNGVGPDGHTASLFPDAPSLGEHERLALAVPPGHEPFVERVTMTIPALANCRRMLFMVTGQDKAEAARGAFVEPPSPKTPASLVRSAHGETVAVVDEAAASLLGK
jgi:6-phosphogluconolactonase